MSRAFTEKHEEHRPGKPWGNQAETAPSIVREDEPTAARTIGFAGGCFAIFGGLFLLLNLTGATQRVGIGLSSLFLALGVVGLLSHACYDRDLQIRRLYWGIGGIFPLAAGILLCLIPFDGEMGGLFGAGYACIGMALLFLLATLHHETDSGIRNFSRELLGGIGALGAVVAFLFGNNFKEGDFLLPYGALLAVMALAYLSAYVSQLGIASEQGYRAALAVGALGLLAVVVGILRSISAMPLAPWGLMYIALGLLYVAVSLGMWSDNRLIVLTRRELSAYFFSPLIYLVLIGMCVVAWFHYQTVVSAAARVSLLEPITRYYFFGLWPVVTVTFMVPVLTMRLLSEERRSGSLEVLLTAPVNELTVVVSKFLAAFLLFLIMWAPWWLFLVALRVGGGVPFDYRSLFTFVVVLVCTGAGFIAMGVFFSSLTRNQVASAVLTFAGMMLFLGLYLLRGQVERSNPKSAWLTVINHMDYIELWSGSFSGTLVPKFLLFHVSAAVVWLFLTVKVLEARRWA